MRRREFITLLGGAAAVWPVAARAQQPGKLAKIGYLGSSTALAQSQWTAAFVQRLRELGWIEGRNVTIEYRWAEGRNERFGEIAAEFVRLKVDVIVTAGTAPVLATKRATSVIPIVFPLAGDPVGNGLVASLARPGGNITGLSLQTTDIGAKRLELLRELTPSGWASVHRELIVKLAAQHMLPAIYFGRYFVADGGLISYGPDLSDQYRRAASYVDRILKGEKPADLPVQTPTKFELVINLKTARALGLTVPPSLLARADEVIE